MIALFPAFAALPTRGGVAPLRVVPVETSNPRWPSPRVACCGECGMAPVDPRARNCTVANCGLAGRHLGGSPA